MLFDNLSNLVILINNSCEHPDSKHENLPQKSLLALVHVIIFQNTLQKWYVNIIFFDGESMDRIVANKTEIIGCARFLSIFIKSTDKPGFIVARHIS